MKMPNYPQQAPTSLDFDSLASFLRGYLETLPDTRTGQNTQYAIADAALSAFSVFFMQSPSFLAHQRQMSKRSGKDNVQSLFQARAIPSDNQIRNLLDPIAPGMMTPVFEQVFNTLNAQGHLEPYYSINGTLLLALDGTRYFSSPSIHCERCQQTHHDNGTVTYSHSVITPAIVAPNNSHVICLPLEFIHHQEGQTKQDCEHNAAKRWFHAHARQYQSLGVTILGDDLYAHQPFIELVQAEGFHFILTCKSTSHKILYQWIHELDTLGKINTFSIKRRHGKKYFVDTYRFANGIPLRDGVDVLEVNWCEILTTNEKGEVTFGNAYITDHEITEQNCAEIVTAGRTRWKIENEHINTLKTKGYHLEHNFGHGEEYLSEMLFTLNIIAFLYHTILHMADISYQAIRTELGSRETFFQHIRTLTYYQYFKNWRSLMHFMVVGLEIDLSANTS